MKVLGAGCWVLVGLVISCGGGDGPPAAHSIEKVSGDSQSVAPLGASAPLVVRVVDDNDQPAAGVIVKFAVTVGTGAVTSLDTTGVDGLASATYTAVTDAGAKRVRAQITEGQLFFNLKVGAGPVAGIVTSLGQDQGANAGAALPLQLGAKVVDSWGNGVAGVPVAWSIASGGGSLSADTVVTDATGISKINRTLGPGAGGQFVRAVTVGSADTVLFHSTAKKVMTVLGGGNNVPTRYTSDLWVSGTHAYTGTWGVRGAGGNVTYVWDVSSGVTLVDSLQAPGGTGTISDNEVSSDGTLLMATGEYSASGLFIYALTDPAHPVFLAGEAALGAGLHTGTFADINGQRYLFAAQDPGAPALRIFRIQVDSTDKIVPVASISQPANYGIHDTYVRDGLALVSDWNTGLRIYDVGNGMLGGSPATPMLVSSIVTGASGVGCNCVHNTWWYHDSAGGKRYIFVGQEGPGSVGSSSSGDIHVVDISTIGTPEEVAFYHMAGAGVHNFWMDETRGILYAAYYNGGVVALDVTGTLSGDLATREIARLQPGGSGNTYVWGVMLANGALWVSDMVSGLWKVSVP